MGRAFTRLHDIRAFEPAVFWPCSLHASSAKSAPARRACFRSLCFFQQHNVASELCVGGWILLQQLKQLMKLRLSCVPSRKSRMFATVSPTDSQQSVHAFVWAGHQHCVLMLAHAKWDWEAWFKASLCIYFSSWHGKASSPDKVTNTCMRNARTTIVWEHQAIGGHLVYTWREWLAEKKSLYCKSGSKSACHSNGRPPGKQLPWLPWAPSIWCTWHTI